MNKQDRNTIDSVCINLGRALNILEDLKGGGNLSEPVSNKLKYIDELVRQTMTELGRSDSAQAVMQTVQRKIWGAAPRS